MRTGVLVVVGVGAAMLIVAWPTPQEPRVLRHRPPAPTAAEETGETSGGQEAELEPAPTPHTIVATRRRAGAAVRLPVRRTPVPLEQDAVTNADPPPGQPSAEDPLSVGRIEPANGRAEEAVENGTAGAQGAAVGEGTPSDADHMPVLAPPVLVSRGTSAYPPEGYHLVLDHDVLTPQLRVDAAQGRVVLRILVRPDGSVGNAEVTESSGVPALDAAALRTAATWRFTPATRDGTPIDAWAIIPVRFIVP